MINFVGMRKKSFVVSGIATILSLIFLLFPGLNFGIDFTGGTLLDRGVEKVVTVDAIRAVLANEELGDLELGTPTIQLVSSNEFIIRTRELSNDEIAMVDAALANEFGEVDNRRTEVVYPIIGQELIVEALVALGLASLGILIYISVRFEFKFAASALIALIHNVIIVIGVFALLGREINNTFVAAILTIVGYSINDTIVIFDRIRENVSFRKKQSTAEIVNTSINQSLSRSINTSLTTFFMVFLLFIFGGAAISDFALALALGIIIGTYSSIFIASPLWLEWTNAVERKERLAKNPNL